MTTTLIDAICAPALLDQMITGGYVRVQRHPSQPLSIYNYTEKAQFENVWNQATLNCRGLIVDNATRSVLARPFAKFFNHGQPGAPVLDLDEPVSVTDKADGSLGVLYPTADGLASNYVLGITIAPDGAVWAGTGLGVSRYTGGP